MEKKYTVNDLSEPLQAALKELNITELSDVQTAVIPSFLEGHDLLVKAATASGKTYAYGIPVAERAEPQGKGKHYPSVLILVPTRELALQTARAIRLLFVKKEGVRTAVLYGGEDMNRQVRMFSKGADIVVATPARLLDHLRRHTFRTKMCHTLIIDEADVMVSMGFYEDVINVASALEEHQTALFSATYPPKVEALCMNLLHEPQVIEIQNESVHPQDIGYYYRSVHPDHKLDTLASMLKKMSGSAIVFCNRRKTAEFVTKGLKERGLKASFTHSELEPQERKKIMERFRNQEIRILCATDVLARGIDLPFLDCVILYDYPEDSETLLHRCGRTSRNMKLGKAVLLLEKKELFRIQEAQKLLGNQLKKWPTG